MLRGHRTFLSLFDEVTQVSEKPERKGRSEILIARRDELLIHRYYYYAKIEGKQYLATLECLENELFISQRRIIDTMGMNRSILRDLHTSKPEVSYFRKKYPWMVW